MYEPFYHLSGKPFQLSPDPSFFYESRVHRRAYAYLEYGLYQGEGFIVITGEVGAGKTILVHNLLAHVERRCRSSLRTWSARSSMRTTCCERWLPLWACLPRAPTRAPSWPR